MKAYKIFNPDWTCRDFKYEVGKTYKHEGKIKLRVKGFHACRELKDSFYSFISSKHTKFAEVELLGEVITEKHKSVTNKIKIVKEIFFEDVFKKDANLSGANLSFANLEGTYLRFANLVSTNLRGANLIFANLSFANLSFANLSFANLEHACLSGTNLTGTIVTKEYAKKYKCIYDENTIFAEAA